LSSATVGSRLSRFEKKPSLSSLSRRYHIEQWEKLQHHQHQQYAEAIGDAHIQWS
jgi:hypothetical protein